MLHSKVDDTDDPIVLRYRSCPVLSDAVQQEAKIRKKQTGKNRKDMKNQLSVRTFKQIKDMTLEPQITNKSVHVKYDFMT